MRSYLSRAGAVVGALSWLRRARGLSSSLGGYSLTAV
jgi:hypothetical protein